ncbi:MAG: efflux RND transporter periplasmic adaptor subunit [Verrucomicrobia bacterium]|nr:efflux RND transporter periplasmic adaptor subunit [Verrucomicrobiota bacterium]
MKASLLFFSTLIVAALAACSPQQAPQQLPPPKVTVTHPQTMTVTNWDEYPGHLEAVEMVEVRPRVHGQIESIHFQDGAEVKAGDLLFVIDPRPYQADLDRACAERQRAETHLELAKNDLKRAESLRSTKAISEEEYDSRSKAAHEADAALAAARAAEASAKLNLDYTRITAPISGKIGRRYVTAGNLVQLQGSGGAATMLATIVSMDPIYCNFDADEAAFLKYRSSGSVGNGLGQKGGSLACELALVNEQNHPHKGRVDFFDNKVNEKTGTIRLRAVFPNTDRSMVSGMFATVRVPAGPPVQALAVPAVAIGSDQGTKLVMIVNKDGVVEPRPVEVDRQHGAMRIVTKGLTPQDHVIVNGLMMARPGARVQIVDTPTNGNTPAAAQR